MNLSYEITRRVNRPWGFEIRAVITLPDTSKKNITLTFDDDTVGDDVITAAIDKRLQIIQNRMDIEAARAEVQDLIDDPFTDVLLWFVKRIRTNPNVTYDEMKTLWTKDMPDDYYDPDKLFEGLIERVGRIPWEQLKLYVINKKFQGVDY